MGKSFMDLFIEFSDSRKTIQQQCKDITVAQAPQIRCDTIDISRDGVHKSLEQILWIIWSSD